MQNNNIHGMHSNGHKDPQKIRTCLFVEISRLCILWQLLWLLLKDAYFLEPLEGLYFNFSTAVIQSLESVKLIRQINCLVTQRPKHFQLQTCIFFYLGLNVSGLGLNIFHKMSPRTHHNYL